MTVAPVPALDEEEAANDGPPLPGDGGIGRVGLAFCIGALGTGLVGIGGISDDFSGGCGTGLVGFGGIAEDAPETAPEPPTCADDEDDCAGPADVVLEGISISALPRAA